MNNQLSQIIWIRVVLTTIVVFVVALITVTLIITGYAAYLGFQARGAPDVDMIDAFAEQYAPLLSSIFLILFTFFGARHAARRVEGAGQINALAVGVLSGLVHAGSNFANLLDLNALPVSILAIGAGWLGSKISPKK
ncbi:MAG: hypothetical protein HC797_05520 [Anaerolineales bacterium]|nr:hypothetical protein [Anaerolineales bacterium]